MALSLLNPLDLLQDSLSTVITHSVFVSCFSQPLNSNRIKQDSFHVSSQCSTMTHDPACTGTEITVVTVICQIKKETQSLLYPELLFHVRFEPITTFCY